METTVLERFESFLAKRYVSHIHTTFSDGANTVGEYVEWAAQNGVEAMLFSEHVRQQPSYEIRDYAAAIAEMRGKYSDMELTTGLEAKLLAGGGLDIPDNIDGVEVIFFACHAFPDDIELYRHSFMALFREPRWKNHVRIWAHPGVFFGKSEQYNIDSPSFYELIDCARGEGVIIEKSLKYDIVPAHVYDNLNPAEYITGYDAHSVDDLKGFF